MNVGKKVLSLVLAAGMALSAGAGEADAQARRFHQPFEGARATEQYHPQRQMYAQRSFQGFQNRGRMPVFHQGFRPPAQQPRGYQGFENRGAMPGFRSFGAPQEQHFAPGMNRGPQSFAGRSPMPRGNPSYMARVPAQQSAIYNRIYSGGRYGQQGMERTPIIMRSPQHQYYYWYPATGAYGQIGGGPMIRDFDDAPWGGLGAVMGANMVGWEVMTDLALANEIAQNQAWNEMIYGYPPPACPGPYGEPEPCAIPPSGYGYPGYGYPGYGYPGPFAYPFPGPIGYGVPFGYPSRGMMRAAEIGAVITGVLGAISLASH